MADIADLEHDIARIKEDVAFLKRELDVLQVRSEYFATKADVEHMGRVIIMWNISSMIALAGIVVAIVKFMG